MPCLKTYSIWTDCKRLNKISRQETVECHLQSDKYWHNLKLNEFAFRSKFASSFIQVRYPEIPARVYKVTYFQKTDIKLKVSNNLKYLAILNHTSKD